ncbi:hypothetical protein C0J52_07855 [Blattella germanica]|nr:hypothetical protein C0J52_07855 [Blattella germanica]
MAVERREGGHMIKRSSDLGGHVQHVCHLTHVSSVRSQLRAGNRRLRWESGSILYAPAQAIRNVSLIIIYRLSMTHLLTMSSSLVVACFLVRFHMSIVNSVLALLKTELRSDINAANMTASITPPINAEILMANIQSSSAIILVSPTLLLGGYTVTPQILQDRSSASNHTLGLRKRPTKPCSIGTQGVGSEDHQVHGK